MKKFEFFAASRATRQRHFKTSSTEDENESHNAWWIASQNVALLGDENCIELRDRSHLCYKSIINYDLDITNI